MRTMAADLSAPAWSMRARLLAADLVAFDPGRLGWTLAVRTIVGLALPLMLAHMLEQPLLVWVGLGAYLLAIGDCTDDGDRAQPLRIIVGTVLGSVALATGVIAGGGLATAVVGMMVWGLLTGMMGAYGKAFATMSLPIAWAYVELGLPAAAHTLTSALLLGGLFGVGGLLMLALTMTLRINGTLAPVRAQTAICFREIARYLEADRREGAAQSEPRVRNAIAEARRLAAQARQVVVGASLTSQQSLVLIEIADRLYSVLGAMRETDQPLMPGCKTALLAIARTLEGRGKPAELRRLRGEVEGYMAVGAPSSESLAATLGRHMLQELCRALRLAADDEPPALPAAPTAQRAGISAAIAPLRANLHRNSVVARHALRFAVVTSAAVVVFWVFPKPFGYWVPLTATVVLKPYAGMTLARAVQRAVGTVTGLVAGLVLMPFLPTAGLQFAAVVILFFAMMSVLPFNYGLAIMLLSAGLIPFEHVLTPGIGDAVGPDRLVATAIGATLALIGGHILWPTFESRGLPDLLRACTEAMAAYADAVIGAAQGDAMAGELQTGRRQAGLALNNLQIGVQRSLTEIGGDTDAMIAFVRASTALQRLSNALNVLLQTAPIIASSRPALAPFRAAFVSALANPERSKLRISIFCPQTRASDSSPEAVALSQVLDHLVSALEMLRAAATSVMPTTARPVEEPRLPSSDQHQNVMAFSFWHSRHDRSSPRENSRDHECSSETVLSCTFERLESKRAR
ncbi:MAG TPA: FUSC family protein [Steroidobacteraceae bacterium]|nr:FUSC family protein [Steroidobacteraceae bacterium]